MNLLEQTVEKLSTFESIAIQGRVVRVAGGIIEAVGLSIKIGEVCALRDTGNRELGLAEVVGFRDNITILLALKDITGIGPGVLVEPRFRVTATAVGEQFIGRIVNALGEPLDEKGPLFGDEMRELVASPPSPLKRKPIREAMHSGVRAIDAFLTVGYGQRVGIMAGSGVGKSVLLGMLARHASADVNVIALIGERGREVAEFIERDLGSEGLAKSVVVVVTSDEMPLLRVKGALLATTLAEYFRDKSKNVLLMMDSLTRVAMAQREIGLSVGEPPTTRGYTPSTFSMMPKLLERAGTNAYGSITGLYTVLVEGDDFNEPVSDTARSILDGHIVLSRRLAARAHYPAIDILESASRVMPFVISDEHLRASQIVRETLAIYSESEDLINIGAYAKGSNPKIDFAINRIDAMNAFLRQKFDEHTGFNDMLQVLRMLSKTPNANEQVRV
ncbi:MAG: FliI/YscN family ATPase [Deferribacteres bacterium]|nr:FliI/YscN family ATPase [candidate division KSB1 bacterium]MCB9501924.1 FliI/YscN family ATPase [Deferribacteres bacterium]